MPNVAKAASSMAAPSSSISRSSLLNMSAIASVISRPSFSARIVDSVCSANRPWSRNRTTFGCSSTRSHVLLDAAPDDLAGGVGGQVDRREDRRPQHVAQPLADRLEQVGLVGEVAVDLRLGGAGLLGDLAQADNSGPSTVDRPEGGVDDLGPHLLAVFAPAFAAGVDLDARFTRRSVTSTFCAPDHCTRPDGR